MFLIKVLYGAINPNGQHYAMELAFHLRTLDQQKALDEFPGHLINLYGQLSLNGEKGRDDFRQTLTRIYLGDEFCPNRLPSPSELEPFYQFTEKRKLRLTFLTPVLTDENLKRYTLLFDYLRDRDPQAEVVVNDWGTLFFFKESYPRFHLAAGRLFNKGFKDPRLSEPDKPLLFSEETNELLDQSTFDHREFQEKMMELGVMRLERALLPYGHFEGNNVSRLSSSVYFPFGYLTTGRVCWVASFSRSAQEKFVPLTHCSQPCKAVTFELKGHNSPFPLTQNGNTVFYQYPSFMLRSLFNTAKRRNLRLVYQGCAL